VSKGTATDVARRLCAAGLGGAALELALAALVALHDVEPGEPLLLRWLRGVTDHPLRAGTAFALALWAFLPFRPRTPARAASDGAATDGARGTR
jgi:hypothetical protein